MTTSEKIRVILIIILILIYLAKRYDLLGKMREKKQEREQEEAKQRALQERKELRKQAQDQVEEKKAQTAEILKRGLGRFQQKSAQVAGQKLWYLEGGARPDAQTILMLHGFAGHKEDWTEAGKLLIDRGYHLVAPDLPGFGQNLKHPDLAYDVTSQTKRVRAFAQKAGLKSFHLAGHSVGGSIAAAIAYAAPKEVASLTLIEPFGVRVPYESELDKMLAQKRNPMVIANEMAYDNLLGFVFHQQPEIPAPLKQLRARQAAENRAFYLKMWQQVREGERAYLLDLLLPVIQPRTLVIQGAASQVIHPATPGVIQAMMNDARFAVVEECGHFPMVERPQETAQHILSFLETGTASNSQNS